MSTKRPKKVSVQNGFQIQRKPLLPKNLGCIR